MRHKRQALILVALLPLLVFAAPGEGSGGSGLASFLGGVLNFFLLFGGLALVGAKPIGAFLAARAADIRRSMEEAAASRAAAEQRLASILERLARVEEEARRIKEAGEAQGRDEHAMILESATREAEKLRAMAREEIEARLQTARRELREYAAELAVALALARIERRLTPEIQARLIDESIDLLGRRNEESRSG
jgi:F-type H+-transporting ATPase subunit b